MRFYYKIGVSVQVEYRGDNQQELLKTAMGYLTSKANEMDVFLPWPDAFHSRASSGSHVRGPLNSGSCIDSDLMKLTRVLCGLLHLCFTGDEKRAFGNAAPNNGFDSCRRIVMPLGPRSETRLHEMHKEIMHPSPSQEFVDSTSDLESWELDPAEHYECGAHDLPVKTKFLIAIGALPVSTPASIRQQLRNFSEFDLVNEEARTSIRFFEDH